MTDAAWVALSLIERLGGKTLQALMQQFDNDPRAVLAADETALRQVRGIGPTLAAQIRALDVAAVERAMPRWEQAGIQVITLHDDAYPRRLRSLPDAPPTLFARGRWRSAWDKSAAIVGTRAPAPESLRLAQNLASELSERGCVVVSGLALGVDASAHLGALAVPGGMTLAVLGSGVLDVYPPANRPLAEAVAARGALVSEVHPFAPPSASSLVARNRIITGLSDIVIVVETEADGGAMHAARFALAQGRQVYAVDSSASGNRALIAAGAAVLPEAIRELEFELTGDE